MEELLRQYIEGQTGFITSWGLNPQCTDTPRITLTQVSGVDGYTSCGHAGFVQSRVQANCYGGSYLQARNVSRALIALTDNWPQNDEITGVFWENLRDGNDGNTTELAFWRSVDLLVNHRSA